MRSASFQSPSDQRHPSLGRRATGFLLALAIEILIAIALLRLGSSPPRPPEAKPRPVAFQLMPEPQIAPKPAPRSRTVAKVKHASGGAAPRSPAPLPVPAVPPPAPPATPPKLLVLSKEQFAASDISNLPTHRGDGEAGAGTSAGTDSGAAYGPGEGPGGERLYNAEWYREPTRAELAYYMPPGAQTGWGLIACRTIENYHVDNCRSLGESPGSGLARALRLAAWQFRVLPPRVGGRPLIGAWVRIRFDLTVGVVK